MKRSVGQCPRTCRRIAREPIVQYCGCHAIALELGGIFCGCGCGAAFRQCGTSCACVESAPHVIAGDGCALCFSMVTSILISVLFFWLAGNVLAGVQRQSRRGRDALCYKDKYPNITQEEPHSNNVGVMQLVHTLCMLCPLAQEHFRKDVTGDTATQLERMLRSWTALSPRFCCSAYAYRECTSACN